MKVTRLQEMMYLKLLEYVGLSIMTQLTNNIYISGDWSKDFVEVTMDA